FGDPGDHGCAACAGAAAFACGDEDHVSAGERLLDLLGVVLCGTATDFGVGTCAQTTREFAAHVELHVGVAHEQRLSVGVDRDELGPAQAEIDHAVDGVDAATADADDLDHGEVVLVLAHGRPPI